MRARRRTRFVTRASRPLWRERPAPVMERLHRVETYEAESGSEGEDTRAGCPHDSGRDARATGEVA